VPAIIESRVTVPFSVRTKFKRRKPIHNATLNMHSTKPLPSIFSPVSTINGEVDNIPEGLRICAIDDSKVTIIEHRFI